MCGAHGSHGAGQHCSPYIGGYIGAGVVEKPPLPMLNPPHLKPMFMPMPKLKSHHAEAFCCEAASSAAAVTHANTNFFISALLSEYRILSPGRSFPRTGFARTLNIYPMEKIPAWRKAAD